jgi:hypothetical protein
MTACHAYQLLKHGYESALREVQLYECADAASIGQAVRYEGEAKAVSFAASKHLAAHIEVCPICRANAGQREGKSISSS